MSERRNHSILVCILGIAIGVLGCLCFQKVSGRKSVKAGYSNWRKLNLILNEVQKNYVDTVNVKDVTDAAVTAALAKLDPHSIYLPPVQLEESETELAGNFDGIGIQFNVPNDTAIVLEVIPGGPSEKVGLQVGDRLLKVDTTTIAGVKFPQDSMVRRMKGPAGTKVKITVKRDREVIPFEITRGKIPVHCVDASYMIDPVTGYIRLSKFSRTTYAEVSKAAEGLLSDGMERLILDLRDNTGGYFDQALLLADLFLEKGDGIVYLQGLHRKREDYKATGRGSLKDIGITILINESSASSSEILAGAIQDNDRGMIIGRRSFGKGMVQEPIYFTDGSGIRLTVARFYTPSGRCIQKPYGKGNYDEDIYTRYTSGEMFTRDSIHVDSTAIFKTVGGRTVYGGGGIIPDIYVPMDTTKVPRFYMDCNRKATQMRFASDVFDHYKGRLLQIKDYSELESFLSTLDIRGMFTSFASSRDGITIPAADWTRAESYLVPQLRALIGRYSPLGDNAFYKLYQSVDEVLKVAMESPSEVEL